MVTFPGYAPLYLAKEKGFFDGLDVQLQRIEEIPSIRAAMAAKKLDAYLATPDIALDVNSKPPGVAVWAVDESAGGDGVVVSGNIKSLADLKGRPVAAEPGLPPSFVLMYLLNQQGLSLKDVQYKDMTTQNAASAFASGAVDAAGIYEPYLSAAAKQRKGSRVIVSSKDVPGLIVDLIFVREDKTSSQADIAKVITGWRRAMQFIRDSSDEAYRVMSAAFKLPVADFKSTVAGIRWLDLAENRTLFGTDSAPGLLYKNFDIVRGVLEHNRPAVYKSSASELLSRLFVTAEH